MPFRAFMLSDRISTQAKPSNAITLQFACSGAGD